MTSVGRLVGFGVWLAVAGGWLAGQAPGQSVWLTGTVGEAGLSNDTSPPALLFDAQDCPRVICDTGGLQYTAGDAAGVIPNWTYWTDVGISIGPGPGQIYLARSGNTLYAGYRSRYVSSLTVRAAVLSGSSWQAYTPSWTYPPELSGSYTSLYGLVIDGSGQPQWLVHNEKAIYPYAGGSIYDYSHPLWGYYLFSHDTGGQPSVTGVALGVGGGSVVAGSYVDRAHNQGGHALLDRFGNLHTVQYCPLGGGSLVYARGPLAGPFQVFDNIEAGSAVKLGRPTVTVDAMGLPHIAYAQQWPGFGLRHLTWTGSEWVGEWIEQGGNVYGYLGTFPKILVDRVGGLHVMYIDALHGQLKHAWKTGGAWQVEAVDSVPAQTPGILAGGMLAAAMDSQGGIGVVYFDAAGTQLKYAYRLPLDQGFVPLGLQPAVEVTNQ